MMELKPGAGVRAPPHDVPFLVRSTDFSVFESEADANDSVPLNSYMVPAKRTDLQSPSDGMHQALFTIDNSKRFIREVGMAVCAMMYMC